ncbi:MAG TPA: hybrid sensor histidine kinase/response regulator [Longimicrobiaceae bacterium]|nr:hybrid sensor histidine kinase/response regulator [Longimicrobiaceae bacterium]
MARVLVVDDQRIPRVAVSSSLVQAGHEVAAEEDGPAGIERAREWRPDVVVLDVHMPGMDGFQVVDRLKQDPETAPIPVIFLTADAPTDDLVVRGLESGAYDFLNKGCSRAELLARVGAMARVKRSYDETSALARISDVLVQTLDPAELGRRLAGVVCHALRADAGLLVLPGTPERPDVRAGVGIATDDPRFFALVDRLFDRCRPGDSGSDAYMLDDGDAEALAAQVETDFRSVAAACVRRAGSRPTLLAVFSGREDAFRHPGDAPLLGLLARQATLALDNAILHAESREQARALEEQAIRLERAMSDRSRFFASMSHELRTPINAILGYGQLLREGVYGALEEKQEDAAERLVTSARHLLELVNDVLDISKLEAGKLEVIPEPTDLAELLRDMASTLELQARDKGLELRVETPDGFPMTTDPARVRQIVLNLLSNAVKFTDRGEVRLEMERNGAWVEVRVADTGPGIAVEDQQRVWDEFEQTASAVSRGGTGLGLAISRRLAALLGGTLSLDSHPGEGSTFTLRLPLAADGGGGAEPG